MEKLFSRLGYGGLGQAFYRFFSTHIGFVVFTNLHGVFMNTLLVRVTGDSNVALKFNIIVYIVMGVSMAASVWVTKRTSPVFTLRTGIVMYLLMYATFFLTLDHLDVSMPLLAIFSGLGAGTYWYANNLGLGAYLNDENRDKGLGLSGVGEGIASLASPFIAGTIISWFDGLAGYLVVFALGLTVAVATIIMSMTLARIPNIGERTHYRQALKIFVRSKGFALMMFANMIKALRAGILGVFLSLLLYQSVESEFAVGFSNLLSGLMAVLGASIYGRVVREKNRFKSMWLSTTVLMVSAVTLLIPGPAAIIIFAMLNSFFGCFMMNPTMSLYFAAIQLPEHIEMQGEFHGIKELVMTVGRVGGALITMYFTEVLSPVLVILLLTLTQYLMIVMQIPVQKMLSKRHSAEI